MKLVRLILKAPRVIQQPLRYAVGLIPPPIRYGRAFSETTALLDRQEYWDRDQLLEYQSDCLRTLVHHAYENVPYYRETWDRLGIIPTDIRTVHDIRKLPFLTKETIQTRTRDLIARNFAPSKLVYSTTGGSTGIPLGFYEEAGVTQALERAFIAKQWQRVGYEVGDKTAVFRGTVVAGSDADRLWEYNPMERSLAFSSYHLTEDRIPRMLEKLRSFSPLFIQAYPSSIYQIAEFMRREKLGPIPSVKAILCGSENLYSFQRQLIQNIFQCRVYSWYGHSEKAVLAGECENTEQYHVFPEYGIAELIDNSDAPAANENDLGEIVGTSLHNFAFPMIRYRTMDLARLGPKSCACGRNHMLIKSVEGRLQELIVSGTGRYVSMTAINMHTDVFDNVRQFQFYQENPGQVTFNIVRKPTYTDSDTGRIRHELANKLGEDFSLTISFVDDIPRTATGKYRFAIQRLSLTMGDR